VLRGRHPGDRRHLRVTARNYGTVPPGHAVSGHPESGMTTRDRAKS